MPSAAKLLQQHQSHFRLYESASDYSDLVEQFVTAFANGYPAEKWDNRFTIHPDAPWHDDRDYIDDPYTIEVRHIVKWCDSPPLDLNAELETELPASAIDFYAEVREAVLTFRNLIMIHPPEWILQQARTRFQDSHGAAPWPPRIVRFARTWHNGYLAFRRRASDSQWRVSLLPNWECESTLISQAYDFEKDDLDIDLWMARMFETDGFPFRIGWSDLEDPFVWNAAPT